MTTIVAPPSNASKWQMGFNSTFKGLSQNLPSVLFLSGFTTKPYRHFYSFHTFQNPLKQHTTCLKRFNIATPCCFDKFYGRVLSG